MSSSARLRSILDNGATILCCTPTYAMRLAEIAQEENVDLAGSRVKAIIVAGEPGGSIPAVRTRLEVLWPGARIFDHHGMTEVGPVTYQCPARTGVLHVLERAYLAEIIEPATGKRTISGKPGELVLTTLGRTGSPLLRYRTGDLVKAEIQTTPCQCGRYELTLAGGILSRVDDMVIVRGVNVYPSAVEEIMRGCPGVGEYRAQISTGKTLPELSLQLEPAADCGDVAGLIRSLESRFETALALRVLISLVPIGTLPRSEMKSQKWSRT